MVMNIMMINGDDDDDGGDDDDRNDDGDDGGGSTISKITELRSWIATTLQPNNNYTPKYSDKRPLQWPHFFPHLPGEGC